MWIVQSHKALFLALGPFLYLLLIRPSAVKILLLELMHDFLPYNPVFPKKKKYGITLKIPCHHLTFTFFKKNKKKRLLPRGSLYCYKITNLPGFPKEEPSGCLWIPSSPLYHICHKGLPFFFFLKTASDGSFHRPPIISILLTSHLDACSGRLSHLQLSPFLILPANMATAPFY